MKVLVGVDDRPNSWRALDRALERGAAAGDEVTVAVMATGVAADDAEARVRERLAATDVPASVRRVEGENAGSELVQIAESEGFDGIVLGGGTRSPMGKIRLGDAREFVVINADVTVTLVR